MNELFMQYLGVLTLLSECAAHVPEELKARIDEALDDAVRLKKQERKK